MNSYRFADLIINMEPRFDVLKNKCEKYKIQYTSTPDFIAVLSDEYLQKKFEENKLSIENSEFFWTGCAINSKLLEYNIFVLHSSAIVVDGEAYLFSADSGVGKSTHTKLWLELFGDRAFIINDDKPAIKFEDGNFFVCGTPFSGNSNENVNTKVPLKAICMLTRGEENKISRIGAEKGIFPLMSQISKSKDPVRMSNLMNMLDNLFKIIPIYSLECNISNDAAMLSYKTMKGIE